MTDLILAISFTLLLAPGLFMVFIPMMPAMSYMFLTALIFGFIDHFAHLTLYNLIPLGAILLGSVVVDYLAGILGAKYGGASKTGIKYGLIGLLVGVIIFPPFGGLAGLFGGVLMAELLSRRTKQEAIKAATGSLLGSVSGTFVNAFLAFVFFVLFIIFAFY